MKRVVWISTGGTIASKAQSPGGPVSAAMDGAALMEMLHERPEGIEVELVNFPSVGSGALTIPDVTAICRAISEAVGRSEVHGVIVTHGTDTMEESVFLAETLVGGEKPVVFTGAQRHAGDPDTDGPRNIADALRVAASERAMGLGAVILFEGDIHAAATVTKVHASRTDTFRSPGLGKLGEVDQGRVHIYRKPAHRHRVALAADQQPEERVDYVRLALGMTPDILDWFAERGTRGVVIDAFGRGNGPRGWGAAVKRLTEKGVPVLICSRCAEGQTGAIYGEDGGAVTFVKNGAILAGALSGVKTRLLLSALLGRGATKIEIEQAIGAYQ
ncbi:asparaginase [Maritimibacter alkaliphilus]|uniref:asparaginase n=1 Tax=Maritimibacter alkaliphilus TaxID=404236 RepID=UPI001C93A3E9|nr:asparaginase [Maritimibacter alkaliphilus]MBY6091951.1 asparaginase [Maritimibacter alkaliphilus]